MSNTRSKAWSYVHDEKCTICDEPLSSRSASSIKRRFERKKDKCAKHKDAYEDLCKGDVTPSKQPRLDFPVVSSIAKPKTSKNLALYFATSTAPISHVINPFLKVMISITFIKIFHLFQAVLNEILNFKIPSTKALKSSINKIMMDVIQSNVEQIKKNNGIFSISLDIATS
jgi:hypothetical protein